MNKLDIKVNRKIKWRNLTKISSSRKEKKSKFKFRPELSIEVKLQNLSERVGITMANLSILKQNKARAIRFLTLNALCRELSCQPGELLEFEPDTEID